HPLALQIDPASDGSDVLLGTFTAERPGTFTVADLSSPTPPTLGQVSAVLVAARRLQARGTGVRLLLAPPVGLQPSAIALPPQAVYGSRARPGNPIPFVPVGILSDPAAADPRSWENQVTGRNGPDEFRLDPDQGFVAGADGIPEIDVQLQLAPAGDPALSN